MITTFSSRTRDERGSGSNSVLVLLLIPIVVLLLGLIVDGGRHVQATARAEATADQAGRAGLDSAAASALAGRRHTTDAVLAARTLLAGDPEVDGSVQLLPGGLLQVTTASSEPALFLNVLGVRTLTGHGSTTVDLVRPAGGN